MNTSILKDTTNKQVMTNVNYVRYVLI
jgi:hypothetical protein